MLTVPGNFGRSCTCNQLQEAEKESEYRLSEVNALKKEKVKLSEGEKINGNYNVSYEHMNE